MQIISFSFIMFSTSSFFSKDALTVYVLHSYVVGFLFFIFLEIFVPLQFICSCTQPSHF